MTFFERELRKIVQPIYPDAVFVGRACYVRLSEMNRAKLQVVTCGMAGRPAPALCGRLGLGADG